VGNLNSIEHFISSNIFSGIVWLEDFASFHDSLFVKSQQKTLLCATCWFAHCDAD